LTLDRSIPSPFPYLERILRLLDDCLDASNLVVEGLEQLPRPDHLAHLLLIMLRSMCNIDQMDCLLRLQEPQLRDRLLRALTTSRARW